MDYNPIYYLFCCSNHPSFGHWLAPVPFDLPFLDFFLMCFLAFGPGNAPGSSWMFPAPSLKSNTSPRSPGSFYWRMVFKNQNLGTRFAHGYPFVVVFYINSFLIHILNELLILSWTSHNLWTCHFESQWFCHHVHMTHLVVILNSIKLKLWISVILSLMY